MAFAEFNEGIRFYSIFTVLVAISLFVGWLMVISAVDPIKLFLIPLVLLVVAGLAWERIYEQGHTF